MGRKRKQGEDGQIELGQSAPKPAPPPTPPSIAAPPEFRPAGEMEYWRVERWEALAAEVPGLTVPLLGDFCQWLQAAPRSATIMKRLFGIVPKKVPLGGNLDDYRAWSIAEVCSLLGITEAELRAEVELVRIGWRNAELGSAPRRDSGGTPEARSGGSSGGTPEARSGGSSGGTPEARSGGSSGGTPEARSEALLETDDELLRRLNFPSTLFAGRDPVVARPEKAWFAGRCREWEKVLLDRSTQRLATQALFKELRLRRLEVELFELEGQRFPDDEKKEKDRRRAAIELSGEVRELEAGYQSQLAQLQETAPWFNVTGKTVSFLGSISDLIEGIREFKAHGDKRLLDGLHTYDELQVLIQTHSLLPEPQYRLGWVTYINESKQGLWDPNWTSRMKPTFLARLDAGFKEGVRQFNEDTDAFVPDMERDGPEGEFEDLDQLEDHGEEKS